MSKLRSVRLTVEKGAKGTDVSGIVRVDSWDMDRIRASWGDILQIEGKSKTGAIAFPLDQEDTGRGIIRMGPLIRENSGASLLDEVVISIAKRKKAEELHIEVIGPTNIPPNRLHALMIQQMTNCPFHEGYIGRINCEGIDLAFRVHSTKPNRIVIAKYDTKLTISDSSQRTTE